MIRAWIDVKEDELVMVVNDLGLLDLSRLLRQAQSVTLKLDSGHGKSYGSVLDEVRIAIDGSGSVTIGVQNATASFSGSSAALTELAEEFVEWGVCSDVNDPGAHTHFSADADSTIAPGSLSLYLAGPHGD